MFCNFLVNINGLSRDFENSTTFKYAFFTFQKIPVLKYIFSKTSSMEILKELTKNMIIKTNQG